MSSKSKRINGEFVLSLLFLLIGIVWAVNGIRLGVWSGITPAPGLFPIIVGGLLTVLSIINLGLCLKSKEQQDKRESRVVLFFLAFIIASSILINYLGMLLTLTISLMIWFKIIVGYKWLKSFVITACIIAGIYAVFVLWLKVPFPQFMDLF